MSSIKTRLDKIRADMRAACARTGRETDSVKLLAVSKTKPIEDILEAAEAGQVDFGENYLQDALIKINQAPELAWHFIGSIQSNKTRDIANHFSWVHSIDSIKVARRLSEQRNPGLRPLNLLLQVNLSGETTKSGVVPEKTGELIQVIRSLPGTSLRGLMTLPRPTHDEDEQRAAFSVLRQLKEQLADVYDLPAFDQLSMGMTADFRIAIEEGATWIRIGTAIFGERQSPAGNFQSD